MTIYTMSRSVTVEDPEELHAWWTEAAERDVDYYTEAAALELLLSDDGLAALDLTTKGVVTFGEVSVEREEEG